MRVVCIAAACLAVAGCATSSADIGASYTSPLLYGNYSCRALAYQDQELVSRVSALTGQLNQRAKNDKIAMGVAVVAFWPAVFFVKGDGDQAAEYARLKGEHDAITKAVALKGCLSGAQTAETAYTPYQPQAPSVAYVQTAPSPPATLQPYSQPANEVSGQVHIDNYGRQQP